MQPCTNVDPEWAYFLRNRAGATNTACRAIESRKNAVPRCLDLMAAKASEIATDRGVMFVEEIMLAAVAKRGSFLGRANDVSKQNGGENSVHRDWRPRTGQKLLDGISDLHGVVADEWYVVFSRKLDIARAGNVLGQITSPSTLMVTSSVRWMTSVGTRIVGKISAISIWLFMRMRAEAAAGLAPSRSNRFHQRWKAGSFAREGAWWKSHRRHHRFRRQAPSGRHRT